LEYLDLGVRPANRTVFDVGHFTANPTVQAQDGHELGPVRPPKVACPLHPGGFATTLSRLRIALGGIPRKRPLPSEESALSQATIPER